MLLRHRAALRLLLSALRGTVKPEDKSVLSAKSSVARGVPRMVAEILQRSSLCKNENENDSGQKEKKYIFMQDKDLEPVQGSYDPQSNRN